MGYYSPFDHGSGVTPLGEGAPSFEGVAERALREQEPGSEATPQPDPVLDDLVQRLNAATEECSAITAKIYGPPESFGTYKGPPYLEKERLHAQLRQVEAEEAALKAQVCEMAEASGLLPRS